MRKELKIFLLAVLAVAIFYLFIMRYDSTHGTNYMKYAMWLNVVIPLLPPVILHFKKKKENK